MLVRPVAQQWSVQIFCKTCNASVTHKVNRIQHILLFSDTVNSCEPCAKNKGGNYGIGVFYETVNQSER